MDFRLHVLVMYTYDTVYHVVHSVKSKNLLFFAEFKKIFESVIAVVFKKNFVRKYIKIIFFKKIIFNINILKQFKNIKR